MTARATPRAEPRFRAQTQPTGWWGMVLFILTEGAIFGLLIATYFYLRSVSGQWPQGGLDNPALAIPIISTVILLLSSAPMVWATWALKHNHRGQVEAGLGLAIILGIAFLVLQGIDLGREDFSYDTNAYGSIFVTLTGFHAAHLVLGICLAVFALFRMWAGHFTPRHRLGLDNTALYWHFVDVVWILVFLTLHVSPYVLPSP